MPNIKSAKKRVKVTKKQSERNTSYKSSLKTAIKKFMLAAEEKAENTVELYKETCGLIDKAAARNILHKNTAARRKSRLTRVLNSMNA